MTLNDNLMLGWAMLAICGCAVAGTVGIGLGVAIVRRITTGRAFGPEFWDIPEISHASPLSNDPVPAPTPGKKKQKKKPKPKQKPLPQQPTREGSPMIFLEGSLSRVRGVVYLDKCAHDWDLWKLLIDHGIGVILPEAGAGNEALDLEHLRFAANERRLIITMDKKDFLRLHKQGHPHAGILISPLGKEWHQEILRICLLVASEAHAA